MVFIEKKQKKLAALSSKEQFDCVFKEGAQIKSSYFVLHYYIEPLSTKVSHKHDAFVDKVIFEQSKLGFVIPKRFAKRAVTRNLIKRQCKAHFVFYSQSLPLGFWILRLKKPLDRIQWRSGSSSVLKEFIAFELEVLLKKAVEQFHLYQDIDKQEF